MTSFFDFFISTHKSDSITADPKQIVLRFKLSSAPAAGSNYKVYEIMLYDEEVRIDPIGNEILIIYFFFHILYKMSINHIQLV